MTKAITTALLAFWFASSMRAAPVSISISKMKVFVTTEPVGKDEFVASDQQRLDSVKDVKKDLAKSVQLVDNEKDADILLKVLTSSPDTVFVLLTAGDYKMTFLGSSIPPMLAFRKWSTADNDAVDQIKKWIKHNHNKLTFQHSKQSTGGDRGRSQTVTSNRATQARVNVAYRI